MAKFKSKEPNHALMAEMSDDPENYDEAEQSIEVESEPEPPHPPPAEPPPSTVTPEPPQVPVAGITPDMAVILATLVQAIQGGNQELAKALTAQAQINADAVEKVARQKMPENTRHPGVSIYNPWGDRDHPRPKLDGKVFVAQKDPKTLQIERLWEEEPEMLTFDELLCLNALTPMGPTSVELTDGAVIKVSVELITNGEGKVEHRLILIPYGLMSKDNKANKNRWVGPRVAKQLLGPERTAEVLAEGRPKVKVAA